ncbi:MAG: hypothetical protein KDA85_13480, partial [Planctomycetaceae bacterium]|nr:hypothetical protein [Planctomycetaceae bacterium]
MNEKPSQSRVKSGVPVWAWAILALLAIIFVVGLVTDLKRPDPEALYQQALQAYADHDVETVKQIQLQLDEHPEFEPQRTIVEGLRWMVEERPLKAVAPFEKAGEDAKFGNVGRTYLAIAYQRASERLKAEAILKDVLAEDPDNALALETQAAVYWEIRAVKQLSETIDLMIEKKVRLPHALRIKAGILYDRHRLKEAAELFIQAIEADPTNPYNGASCAKLIECLYFSDQKERIPEWLPKADPEALVTAIDAEQAYQKEGFDVAKGKLDQII